MDEDPLISEKSHARNVIESVSGISNVYLKRPIKMGNDIAAAHNAEFVSQTIVAQFKWQITNAVCKSSLCDGNSPQVDHPLSSAMCYMIKQRQMIMFLQCRVNEDTEVW